ncbi:MAG: hypothetical protein PHQ66_01970 [Candidatus Nanoarchaeia archaeon]|nr:hypothetical protein [Candidatus Nanoarchaeia archaeon]MDD5357861.1 hypothetical protein [Candidatus Nanoarchaeia archaeon]MDD5588780.1 hypothetical protein [Candidatus Nanoarchaeia archaeon]
MENRYSITCNYSNKCSLIRSKKDSDFRELVKKNCSDSSCECSEKISIIGNSIKQVIYRN